jgi:hypothetical protein
LKTRLPEAKESELLSIVLITVVLYREPPKAPQSKGLRNTVGQQMLPQLEKFTESLTHRPSIRADKIAAKKEKGQKTCLHS